MKLNKEIKILLLEILKSNEITDEQKNELISKLEIEHPFYIMPDGTKILV